MREGALTEDGWGWGVLIKVQDSYQTWWHTPEQYVEWKAFLKESPA